MHFSRHHEYRMTRTTEGRIQKGEGRGRARVAWAGESNVESRRAEKRRLIAVSPLKDDSRARVSLFLSRSLKFSLSARVGSAL